jgi:dihydroxyacetone kinase
MLYYTALLTFLEKDGLEADAARSVSKIAELVEDNMDGTSGAIYSIFTQALAGHLQSASTWPDAFSSALKSLGNYTPARVGDRTLVDALEPFIKRLTAGGDLLTAIDDARKGTEATKGMKASLGRSVYVGGDIGQVPDPGAVGVVRFLEGFAGEL